MTDKQYPPLPVPLHDKGDYLACRLVSEDYFTADQMRAYVDADRAQRSCDATSLASKIIELAEQIAFRSALAVKQHFEGGEISGTPEGARALKKQFVDAVHALCVLNNPSRPDAGNTQE